MTRPRPRRVARASAAPQMHLFSRESADGDGDGRVHRSFWGGRARLLRGLSGATRWHRNLYYMRAAVKLTRTRRCPCQIKSYEKEARKHVIHWWDVPGCDGSEPGTITRLCAGAAGGLLVFDRDVPDSFHRLSVWLKAARKGCVGGSHGHGTWALVGNSIGVEAAGQETVRYKGVLSLSLCVPVPCGPIPCGPPAVPAWSLTFRLVVYTARRLLAILRRRMACGISRARKPRLPRTGLLCGCCLLPL